MRGKNKLFRNLKIVFMKLHFSEILKQSDIKFQSGVKVVKKLNIFSFVINAPCSGQNKLERLSPCKPLKIRLGQKYLARTNIVTYFANSYCN